MDLTSTAGILFACYALGCVTPAYYAVKWLAGRDIRESGTGNVGATNAGRILGKKAYVAIALLDILKGWAGPTLAAALGLSGWWLAAAGAAVTAGHLWPAQLRFRGGKGMATAYGVLIYFSPWAALCMWAVFLPGRSLLRSTTLGAVMAFIAAPLLMLVFYAGPVALGTAALLAVVVTLSHRTNIAESLQRRRESSAALHSQSPTA